MNIDVKLLGQVFRAAAAGQMRPYEPNWQQIQGTSQVGVVLNTITYRTEDKARAQAMADSFKAIAEVFEGLAKAEKPKTKVNKK